MQKNSEIIRIIYSEDQNDRRRLVAREIDWSYVGPRDEQRLLQAQELVKNDISDLSAEDLLHLSFIFQHGDTANDSLVAHNLAKRSLSLGLENALEMVCATWDRYLWRTKKVQVYGTQYRIGKNGQKVYKPIDYSISDQDLLDQGLPTRKEFQATLPQE